jgi:2-dehydropantoate 2-reductase
MTGTTAQGATILGPGIVMQGGRGETHIGRFSGTADKMTFSIAEMFEKAGIHTQVTNDVQSLVWGKLIVNVGINAATALLGLRNGQVAQVRQVTELAEMAVNEAVQVSIASGIILPYSDPMQKVLEVARATAQNKSSMLQDIRNHRQTEVEAINGAIVRLGVKFGIPTPVNRTLTLLVEAAQQHLGE